MSIVPEQCRAARALIGWSQDDLVAQSGVAKKTIADFERGASIPYDRTLRQLAEALEVNGVIFIPENGGGAGVRRRVSIPRLSRRRMSRFERMGTFAMTYRSAEYRVTLPTDILDDLDRTNYQSDAQYEEAFDRHLHRILLLAASVIDRTRAAPNSEVTLTHEDFFP